MRMRRSWRALPVATCVALLACGAGPSAPGGEPQRQPAGPAPAAPPTPAAKDEPPPVAKVEPPTAAAPQAGAKLELAGAVVAWSPPEEPIDLFQLTGAVVAAAGRRYAALPAGDQALAWSTLDNASAGKGNRFEIVGGAWPGAVAVAAMTAARTASTRVTLQRSGERWRRLAEPDRGLYVSLAPWTNRRTLAVRHVDMWGADDDEFVGRIDILGGAPRARLSLPAGARPVAVTTSPSGQVFAVLAIDDDPSEAEMDGPAYVAQWAPDGRSAAPELALPKLGELAPQANDVRTLVAFADDDVWIAGGVGHDDGDAWTPYAIRHDGAAWTQQPLPDGFTGLLSSAAACRGAHWFTAAGELPPASARWVAGRSDRPGRGALLRRDQGGVWHDVTVKADRFAATGDDAHRPRMVACAGETLWVSLEPGSNYEPKDHNAAETHALVRVAP